MTNNVETQIRGSFEALDDVQAAVTVEDILHAAGPVRPVNSDDILPPVRTWRKPVLAALVAAVVVFVALVPWILASSTPGPPVNEPTTTSLALPDPVGLAGPIVWVWEPDLMPDPAFSEAFIAGPSCYGSSQPPNDSTKEAALSGGTITIETGANVTPLVTFTDQQGSTDVGNPFGNNARVCTIATDGTTALAVGSDIWWSTDGITWNVVESSTLPGGAELSRGNLIWSAAGPLGYVVLGPGMDDGWYSPDLKNWYVIPVDVIPVEDRPGMPIYRGWIGPGNVTITDETIIIPAVHLEPGAWKGTLQD